MAFWHKTKKKNGWMAIALAQDGVLSAVVQRHAGAKPAVLSAAFHPGERAQSAALLARIGKDLDAAERHCSNVLASGEYQILSVEAPNVPAAEMKTAVGWRLKDMIDFPVADATIDVADIPVASSGTTHNHQVFAVAARNTVIEGVQAAWTEAKVALDAIDIPEMAQRNLSALLEPEGRGLAMLSFDHRGGLLTVTFRGELYLARRMDVTLAQVEGPHDDRQQYYDRITLELQRSLDHFERQFQYVAVAKLVLAPTGSTSLHDYLASNLYLPTDMLDLAAILDLELVPELHDAAQQARLLTVLGGALRDDGGAP